VTFSVAKKYEIRWVLLPKLLVMLHKNHMGLFFMINHVGLNDRNNIENGEPTVMTSSNDFMLNIVTDG
jgi:hypothetical protein